MAAAPKVFSRVGMTVSGTPGTGNITLLAAITDATNGDFFTFAERGVANNDTVAYLVVDGNNVALETATYSTTGPALTTRATTWSKIGGTNGTTTPTLTSAAKIYSVESEELGLSRSGNAFTVDTTGAIVQLVSGTALTTPTPGALEFVNSLGYLTTLANSNRGVLAAIATCILNANYTLTSTTSAQKIYNASTNGAVQLPIGTYSFECIFALTNLSATSGTYSFGAGGTATYTYAWKADAVKASTFSAGTPNSVWGTTTVALVAANTSTGGWAIVKGVIRVTAAGTFIPQITLSVASAGVVQAGSWFSVFPVGNSGSTTLVGNWS